MAKLTRSQRVGIYDATRALSEWRSALRENPDYLDEPRNREFLIKELGDVIDAVQQFVDDNS